MNSDMKPKGFSDPSTETWAAFYDRLQSDGKIPDASKTTIAKNNAVFRSMALNLSSVKEAILTSGFSPLMTTIYTDVLTIPKRTDWTLEGTLLIIYARRIEVEEDATILMDYSRSDDAQLLVCASEMSGTLLIEALDKSKHPVHFNITQENLTPGFSIGEDKGNISLEQLSLEQSIGFQLPGEMKIYLHNAFIYGSLLYDQNQQLALSIFLWVKTWASQYEELHDLFYRSTTLSNLLSSEINAAANGARFVPNLTATVYTDLAKAYAAQAAKYESDYMQLYVCTTLTAQHIAMAKTMVANADSEEKYVKALLKQANTNYDNAVSACSKAQRNFSNQQIELDSVLAKFQQIGLPDYTREKIIEAVFSMVTAIGTFAAAAGSMAMGNAAGGPAAADSAIKGVSDVAKASKDVADVAKAAGSLGDSMKQLKKLLEGLKKVYDLAKAVMAVAGNISSAKSQIKVINKLDDNTNDADLSAADGWAVYKIQADNILKQPVEKGIGYAAQYKEALDILVVYGQSLSASQLAVIKASQEVAAITFRVEFAKAKQTNLQQLVDSLKAGDAPVLEMMQQFYQKYIDSKSSLFAAIKSYQASYFFWALRPSETDPKIVDSVGNLNAGIHEITNMVMDTHNALQYFEPEPQDLKNLEIKITDSKVLQSLKDTAAASWIIPFTEPRLKGRQRVRFNTVRIWLEGAVVKEHGEPVRIMISTTGNYLDRYDGKSYQFTGKPLTRAFEYTVKKESHNSSHTFDNGEYGFVIVDGAIDKQLAYAYFEPTPFSEWSIKVENSDNNIDLSNVTKVVMYFEGTNIDTMKSQNTTLYKETDHAAISE